MAVQKFMSPGVFTREIDLSFLAQGVAGIGAVVIGTTPKGPAHLPILVTGMDAFSALFGAPTPGYQLTYAAKNYLKNSNVLTVVRVLGHDDGTSTTNGYSVPSISAIRDVFSGSAASQALAEIHYSGTLSVAGVPNDANNFTVRITGPGIAVTASFLTSSANYIGKVLNTDPTKYSTYGHYLYRLSSFAKPAASASWGVTEISGATTAFTRNFSQGISAWVKSQPIGGTDFNLFRFNTLAHGKATNNDIKVMISNVKPTTSPSSTQFGTFTVSVRDFNDTDQKQVILESFPNVTLDPNAPNYILRMIGDQFETFDTTQRKFIQTGDWENKSKYIRVEVDPTVNAPAQALPWGHRGYMAQAWNSSSVAPNLPLAINQIDKTGAVDGNICWGISFVSGGIHSRMKAFPNSAVQVQDPDFSLAFLSATYLNGKQVWNYQAGLSSNLQQDAIIASASLYQFVLPFQGGFDGWDLRVADPLYLQNTDDETVIGVVSAKRAIDEIANPDAIDTNLLAIPGVHNLKVTDKARAVVNDRMDAMYVMDITGSSVAEAIGGMQSRDIDDNYTACYYPDVKIDDKTALRKVRVSPSVVVLGAIAYSDRVSQPFFAPAGLNRAGLKQFDVTMAVDRLNWQDRDNLYSARINPIATFPNEGVVVWGQKTLQVKASALDRVNVRRLLIFAKKTVAAAAKLLVFDPSDPQSWQRFLNAVNPILEKIRQDRGVNRFKVVMDTTTNTPDLIDRNVMAGKIFLEPTKAAEFISLDFIITAAGVQFGE